MNRVFRPGRGMVVPDGTRVFPFLNPSDSTSGLPAGIFDGVSVALGEIAAGEASKLQVHPLVTVVIWVVGGRLDLKMKDDDALRPYLLTLEAEDAAVARPGTLFQLSNSADRLCRVLYIVSPPYVFLQGADGAMIYDDAVVLDIGWDALAAQDYRLPHLDDLERIRAAREQAVAALAQANKAANRR